VATLAELLDANKEAVHRRWLADTLASYPEDAAVAFGRQKDPFANPVGAGLREGTRGILDALVEGTDPDGAQNDLEKIIKIRSVQEFSASGAVGFVFRLKEVLRAELGRAAGDPGLAPEWAKLDGRIDRIGLAAFDVFVGCREQVCQLRINDVKRNVSWVLEKMQQRGLDPESARGDNG